MSESSSTPGGGFPADMAEFVQLFVDETGEQLDALVETLLRLEAEPASVAGLNEAFRLVHSIKGASALLGLERVTTLTHHLETHLERLRSGRSVLDAATMNVMLRSVDFLRSCTQRLRNGEPIDGAGDLLDDVKELAAAAGPVAGGEPLVTTTADPCGAADSGERPAPDVATWRVAVRFRERLPLAEMKAELILTRLAGLGTVVASRPPREALAEQVGLRGIEVILAAAVDRRVIAEAATAEGVEAVSVEAGAAGAEWPATEAKPLPTQAASGETVRVEVGRLDVLLDLAGELVVNRARLKQLAGDMAPLFRKAGGAGLGWEDGRRAFGELVAAIDQLTRVSSGLQRGVLDTRMVPVGPLFNRFKRSIRDIARDLDKQVRLEVVGEKTELDKRMIDELGDPLNHMIRNCIDHGIEPAEVRRRAGKPEVATVRLSAAHRGNNVVITVEDDGGGIDTDRVRRIALERGVISAERAAAMDERELTEIIFEPGFSTATRVSDISGRGVGMDVVRTRIAALNGTVESLSERGRGTRFTIRLPLTLTIMKCMLFRLPQGVLAVPLENVREITPAAAHRTVILDGRQLGDIRGELVPLVRIDDLFRWPLHPPAPLPLAHVAVLTAHGRTFGLRVDELLGGQDLVVKPLDDNFIHIRGLGGASILGDGSVCLLLDVAASLDLLRRGADGAAARTS